MIVWSSQDTKPIVRLNDVPWPVNWTSSGWERAPSCPSAVTNAQQTSSHEFSVNPLASSRLVTVVFSFSAGGTNVGGVQTNASA